MLLTSVSIRKPLMMVMVILAVVLFGVFSFTRLPVDMMPEMDLPYITVQTIYIGAGPEEIESSVVKPIEEEMTTISGLKNMTSYCQEGVGFIVLEFDMAVDADLAAIDVKDKIDAILYNLPSDLLKPIIGKFDPNAQPIIQLGLTGPATPEKLRQMADKNIKEQLVRINGVGKVDVVGGREREIHVNLSKEKIDAHGLSIFQVFPLISAQSANFPAGRITGDLKEYTVRVQGEFESIADIANLRIPVMAMGPKPKPYEIRLSDIAEVRDAFKEIRDKARLNGLESVGISVLKRPDANTVGVAENILGQLVRINALLPDGFELIVTQDRSQFIKDAVNDSYSSMAIGVGLTSLILLLFLFDWKLALIAAITMPASVIMALVGMDFMGFSLNIVTLMALSISVGILVANSIVVLENIVRFRNRGMPVREASETGTNQIITAVLASALTNLAVFIPIATTGGITGNIFKALGLTIVFATIASLFLSFTLTPLMTSRLLKGGKNNSGTARPNPVDRLMGDLEQGYGRSLSAVLEKPGRRWGIVALTILVFLLTMGVVSPRIGSEFFPDSDQGYADVAIELPPGTPLSITDRVASQVEGRLRNIAEVDLVSTKVGGEGMGGGVNVAGVLLRLKPVDQRRRTTKEVAALARPMLADLPDAKIVVQPARTMGGPSEADLEVEVRGLEMVKILALADSVKQRMDLLPGLVDIRLSYKGVKPELKFIPDRERLEQYGLSPNLGMATTVQSLGGIMRFTMTGNDQAVFREEGEDYPIRVQLDEADRNTIDKVENLTIPTPSGFVPVKALANVQISGGASSITRKNRQRMVSVLANVSEGTSGEKVVELNERFAAIPLDDGYSIGFGGTQEWTNESFRQLLVAGLLAVILTYMVLVGLLESLVMALVIWLTLPLGMIGVVWSLFLTGNSFSMMSNMSIIMLIGVVVNNAILMIDYARQERRDRGISAQEAIVVASTTKLKAILMMNLAIILAMLPQALALGSGGEMRAPFAITAIGGILVSTVMTLFVIPALYVITAPKRVISSSS